MLDRLRRVHGDDRGVGLIIVMQFMMVASALGLLVAATSTLGKHSATQDAAGAAAHATSDAGVAEAINYIRSNSLRALTCDEPVSGGGTSWKTAAGCTATGWANPSSPVVVSGGIVLAAASSCVSGQDCYQVWIGRLQAYTPAHGAPGSSAFVPATPAVLRIHSTGVAGVGPGGRAVAVEVKTLPTRFPFGVFANTFAMPASHSPAASESIFTTGNVSLKCPLTGLDYANNIPAAIHAAGVISYNNGSCHPPSNATSKTPCDTNFPYDQDSNGVDRTGSACFNIDKTDPNFSSVSSTITAYPQTQNFKSSDLYAYGYRPGGLSAGEYAQLKAQAVAQNTYNNTSNLTTVIANLVAAGVTNPVIYTDDGTAPDPSVLPAGFFRDPTSTNCPAYAVTIVVRGATSVQWTQTGGSSLVGSLFVPDTGGSLKFAGQASLIGTLFADNIQFNGNGYVQLDPCFVSSPPGGVLDVTVMNYRSVDTGNVQ